MAKIILVSEKVDPTTWQLALSLKNQQHKVILLTSRNETVPDSSGIEFMAYFKNWSILESIKIIPLLFGIEPQVLHLILPNDKLNTAQFILSLFAKTHPHCLLSTTLLNVRRGLVRKNPVRYLIEESDIVTCPTIETLGELRGLNIKSTKQGRGVLPPVLNLELSENNPHNLTEKLINEEFAIPSSWKAKSYVVVPFHEVSFDEQSDFFLRIKIICQTYKIILWGSYGHWSLRSRKKFHSWFKQNGFDNAWLITGDIKDISAISMLQNSVALLTAGQELDPAEFTEYVSLAITSKCPIIIDSEQANIHPTMWRNEENCWIFDRTKLTSSLVYWLARKPHELKETISEKIARDRNIIDSPFNDLSRLYSKALNSKAWIKNNYVS